MSGFNLADLFELVVDAAPDREACLTSRSPHFPAQANAVIVLLQNGGPSQMDLFDPKPELQKRDGQKHSERIESFQPGGIG